MQRFDESSAEVLVFTQKEGLLSAAAHALKIRVTRFSIEVDEAARTVVAQFDPRSLRVVCAMDGDAESPGTLGEAQHAEIEANIVRHVLHADRHPEIRFRSTAVHERGQDAGREAGQEAGDALEVEGVLSLHGSERPIRVSVRREGEAHVAEAVVHQPEFGIRPYSALMGAIRVAADVRVRVLVRAG